jgi:hypothetical protein
MMVEIRHVIVVIERQYLIWYQDIETEILHCEYLRLNEPEILESGWSVFGPEGL